MPARLHRPLPVSCLPMPSTAKPAHPVALLQVGLAHQVSTTDAWQPLQPVMRGLPYVAGRLILLWVFQSAAETFIHNRKQAMNALSSCYAQKAAGHAWLTACHCCNVGAQQGLCCSSSGRGSSSQAADRLKQRSFWYVDAHS